MMHGPKSYMVNFTSTWKGCKLLFTGLTQVYKNCSMDKITAQFQARIVLKAFLFGNPKNLADCHCNKLNFLQAYTFASFQSSSMHELRH